MSFQHVALQGAAPVGTQANKRATVRYLCAPATAGRVALPEDHEFQRAWIMNLSAKGIGLCMARPLKMGTFLAIQVKSSQNRTYDLAAMVAHSTQRASGDFLIGCELVVALSDEDLDILL